MIESNHDRLVQRLDSLPPECVHPHFYPSYVVTMADAIYNAEPCFFYVEEGDEFFYFPFLRVTTNVHGQSIIDHESPYGYTGYIATSPEILAAGELKYREYCEHTSVIAEFVRFNPLLQNHMSYAGNIQKNRQVAVTQIPQDDALSALSKNARNIIRRTLRDPYYQVDFEKSAGNIGSFINLYSSTMERLNADTFYRFPKSLLNKLIENPLSHLITIRYRGIVIASGIFIQSGKFMEYSLSGSHSDYSKYEGTRRLLFEAIRLCQTLKVAKLHLGGGRTCDEKDSLFRFKTHFSNQNEVFYIGSRIFNQKQYDNLKKQLDSEQRPNNRVLFYR